MEEKFHRVIATSLLAYGSLLEHFLQVRTKFFKNNLYFFLSLVVSRVGRDLAPFLKALVPSWHVLCSDPHIPASIHAKSAFLQAFNGDSAKSRDAILFCQLEILAYIAQNLLQHTASTLSDPK
jgi:hypothetical protein